MNASLREISPPPRSTNMSLEDDFGVERASSVCLRQGQRDAPLYLFGGIEGDPAELAKLAAAMLNTRELIGITFCSPDSSGQIPSTIPIMAARSYSTIRAIQARGPYHMLGYSFGGLIAIEVARLLQSAGEDVAFLGIIDTRYAHRYWPTAMFYRSQAHLVRRHIQTLLRLPLAEAIPMLFYRARGFIVRILTRAGLKAATLLEQVPSKLERHLASLSNNHCPAYYRGKITLFRAENIDDYGCDPAELWRQKTSDLICRIIPGQHNSIVKDPLSISALAAAIDRCLDDLTPQMRES